MTTAKTKVTDDPWADIDVTFETRTEKGGSRPTVEVPASAQALVDKAHASGQRILMPIKDAEDFEYRANILHSAGRALGDGFSVITVCGILEPNEKTGEIEFLKTDIKVATHLRSTVARRRGKPSKTRPSDSPES